VHEFAGLLRRSAVDLVPLPGDFEQAKLVFVARLALCGRLLDLPQRLSACHETAKSVAAGSAQQLHFPEWRRFAELLASVRYGWLNTPIRAMCIASVLRYEFRCGNWTRLIRDVASAARTFARQSAVAAPVPAEPASPVHSRRELRPVRSKAAA
jgi:hypothetical protein